MFQTKVVEKIVSDYLCPVFLFSENPAVNEIMWTCMKQPEATECRKYAIFMPDN